MRLGISVVAGDETTGQLACLWLVGGAKTKGRPCEERADIPKSNWSYPIDKGPFLAFNVTPGITFGFGGLASPQDLRSSTQRQTRSLAYLPRTNSSEVFFGGYPEVPDSSRAVYSGALPVEKRQNHKLRFGY